MISYIKYFFYLALNWDLKIAYYILKQEIRGGKKYGIHTTGADEGLTSLPPLLKREEAVHSA